MASIKIAAAAVVVVFPAALLLLLATSSMADAGAFPNSPGESCYTPWGYPSFEYPLARCRAVARSRCAGAPVDEGAKADCCRQLAAIDNSWCRCAAISKMRDIMYKEVGVTEGAGKQAVVFPGCRRDAMDLAAASIPAMCDVFIPNTSGGVEGVCYWVDYPLN